MRSRLVVLLPVLVGCATATRTEDRPDANEHVTTDAAPGQDSSVQPDGPPGCTVVTMDLLTNGNFDDPTAGNGWSSMPIDAMYPIVTADTGIVGPQSAPNRAWMGGFAQASATDELYQDVAIPASATAVRLTGFYEVRTSETGSTVYDSGTVALTSTTNTVIEQVLALDNAHPTTAWTAIDHTFSANVAGQTVRLRFQTSNDTSLVTSFFFDTLALEVTYCQ